MSSETDPTAAPVDGDEDQPRMAEAVRFCADCGRMRDPDEVSCVRCESIRAESVTRANRVSEIDSQRKSMIAAMALYFCLLSVSIGGMLYLAISQTDPGLKFQIVLTSAFTLMSIGWFAKFPRAALSGLVLPRRWWWLVAPVGLGACTFALASFVVYALVQWTSMPKIEYTNFALEAGYGLWLPILLICVQPAVFEELAFRGVMLNALQRAMSVRDAVIASSLMFAILHLAIPSIPHLFVLGMVLAWVRLKSGSIIPSIILHFTHNFLVVLVEYLYGS
jgi:uncharacterized protein